MTVELIVVADRPAKLPVLLHALKNQTRQDWTAVVLDQSPPDDDEVFLTVCCAEDHRIGYSKVPRIGDWGQTVRFDAAKASHADVVGFPCDDAYYVPTFLEKMMAGFESRGMDLMLCGWLYDAIGYQPMPPQPRVGFVDVGGFLIRRRLVVDDGWPDRSHEGDGRLVERVLQRAVRIGFCSGCLYVKN